MEKENTLVTMKVTEKTTGNITYVSQGAIAITRLLGMLWNTKVIESKGFKMRFNYNYSDMQTITFSNGKVVYEFSNIPTSWGMLDDNKLWHEIVDEYKTAFSK